ncbi:MAG: YfiR family protein [Endozoicomonas sp.]
MPIQVNILKSLAISLVIVLFSAHCFELQAAATKEDKVKTAIIYKITKFISWPNRKQVLTLCILGEGPINIELNRINRKNSMGRRLSITHKDPNAPFEKLCDALYIHSTDNQTINKVIDRLKGKPVLTISDAKNFAEQGGVIGLTRKGSRINFSINKSSANAANLTINSQLLGLAKIVK